MFYLIWQMGLLLLIAIGIGLFIGRQIWSGDARSQEADEAMAEIERLRRENENLARRLGECEVRGNEEPVAAQAAASTKSAAKAQAAPVESVKTGASASPLDEAAAVEAVPDTTGDEAAAQPEEDVKTGAAAMPNAAQASTGGDDDLTELKGLGPKAAAALNEAGITRFTQIAGWSDEDVASWDAKINGRGRIVRDDWVGQAKARL